MTSRPLCNHEAVASRAAVPAPLSDHAPIDCAAALTSDLSACLPLFPVLTTQLREAVQEMEEAVVEIGSRFQSIVVRARQAVAPASRVGATGSCAERNGKGMPLEIEGLIDNTRTIMGKLLQRIEQTCAVSNATVERMREIENRMTGLEAPLDEIDKVAAHARLLALNGQLEAARAGENGAAFAIVATETAKMANHAVTTNKAIRKIIETLSRDIVAASSDLQLRASADTEEAALSRGDVNGALDAMAGLHHEMQAAVNRAQENAEQLARDVSQVVTSMQSQDAMSQRIGHVIEMLDEIYATLRAKLENAAAHLSENAPTAGKDWVGGMVRQYTMNSERKALAAHLTTEKSGVQNSGNNVELF